MLALTVWPEWAYGITHLGKPIENRGWTPPRSLIGQDFALHAGKSIGGTGRDAESDVGEVMQYASDAGYRWGGKSMAEMGYPAYCALCKETVAQVKARSGGIVALVRLDGWLPKRQTRNGWHMPDSFGWQLTLRKVLQDPVPCKGMQGLWMVPNDILGAVLGMPAIAVDKAQP